MKKLISIVASALAATAISASAQSSAEVKAINDSIVIADVIDYMTQPPVIKSDLPVVIDLWAPWCGPCRRMAPIVDELAEEYAGKVAFYKVNVDDNPQTSMAFRAQSIPMLVFIPTDGKQINAVLGVQPKETLKEVIDKYLLAPAAK